MYISTPEEWSDLRINKTNYQVLLIYIAFNRFVACRSLIGA